MLFCILSAGIAVAQESDDTIIEFPDQQEDAAEVEPLPDWLIDIPAAETEAAERGLFPVQPKQYIVADEHVVSQSRMFSVSGGDSLRMGAIASHADDVRRQVNHLLNLPERWKYAIVIRLIGTTADTPRVHPIRTGVRIISQEPSLRITVYAGGGISLVELDKAIISTLLYEYALRSIRPDALPDTIEMPPWLVTGIQQATLWRQGRVDRRYYENLFNKSEMISPEDLVNTADPDKLDASSRQLYDVSCGVLVMGLLHRSGGADRLKGLLSEALTQEGSSRQLITAHFHEMGVDSANFSKWWALTLASLAMPQAMDMLTPLETEKRVSECLRITGMDPDKRLPYNISITDLPALRELPDWKQQVSSCMDQLTELSTHAFPGYQSIIMEYMRALSELLSGAGDERVVEIIKPLEALRAAYKEASVRGRDYLDWFEITQLGATSSHMNHSAYMKAMHQLRAESSGPDSHISRYLDDIETLYTLKAGEPLPESLRPAKTTEKKP